jgi:hypothetical protein
MTMSRNQEEGTIRHDVERAPCLQGPKCDRVGPKCDKKHQLRRTGGAQRLDLKGIVAQRKADAYRPETVWYKIKSRTYTQGEGRWELFQKRG